MPMHEYADQLKRTFGHNKPRVVADANGEMQFEVCERRSRASVLWIIGRLREVDANTVRVTGKTGVPPDDIFTFWFSVFLGLTLFCGIEGVSGGGSKYFILFLYPLLIAFFLIAPRLGVRQMRAYLLECVQAAGKES